MLFHRFFSELKNVFLCKRKRAFIAAPLIGTIIFITALVFVVNVDKSESNAITQVSQEAYHNRITAIVELYRLDAGSLFKEDVKAVIEQALTSECWNLFDIQVNNAPTDSPEQKQLNYKQARFDRCQNIKQTVYTIICSNTGEAADSACINSCNTPTGLDANCLRRCAGDTRQYGLQNFLANINQEFNFEGMTLSPSNAEKFQEFFSPRQADGHADITRYISNCHNLLKSVTIDCAAFAEGNLQCCKDDVELGSACPAEKIIPGCETGIFYVDLAPGNPQVFESLPRIQVKDDDGNYLRAGALGDANELLIPINFPLFRYLDTSFNAYKFLAYGDQVGIPDQDREGVLDGICRAPDAICTDAARLRESFAFRGSSGTTREDSPDTKPKLGELFYQHVFLNAFQRALPNDIDVQVLNSVLQPVGICSKSGGSLTCEPAARTEIENAVSQSANIFLATPEFYPYFGPDAQLRIHMKLLDRNPTFRVNPRTDNAFCSTAILKYKSP